MSRRAATVLLAAAAASVTSAAEPAPRWNLDRERSVLAIVTRKAGVAAGLAHDHLIAAGEFDARVAYDPARASAASVEIELPVEGLRVDDDGLRDRLEPRLIELGLLDEPFGALGERDRRKIRREMLARGQLDAARNPLIRGRLVELRRIPQAVAAFPSQFAAEVELEVHGERRRVPLNVRRVELDGAVRIEAWGATRFSEFGIEPYSAFLGAVRNRDEFSVYLSFEMVRAD